MRIARSDRWRPVGLAVVFHAVIAGGLLWGYWQFRKPVPPAAQVLAIEATVVDASRLMQTPASDAAAATETAKAAEPAPPEPPAAEPPLKTDHKAEARAKKAEERIRKDEAKKLAAEKANAEKAEKAEKARKDAADKAKEASDRKVREESDRKAKEEADRKAREKAAADRLTAQRESELRASMAAEEHFTSAQAAGLLARYQAQIQASIERAWIRPSSARPGLSCEVRITQVPSGEVVGVQVGRCNGDESVRQSIEAAAYRASPLPKPPDPALFDRNLVVTFRPQD